MLLIKISRYEERQKIVFANIDELAIMYMNMEKDL